MEEEYFDAGDKKKVNERNSRLGRERESEQNFLKTIMSNAMGRKWMFDLLEECSPLKCPAIGSDALLTFQQIGRQDIGRKLYIDIEIASPDGLLLMMKEARERVENEIRKNNTRKKD